MTQRNVQGAAKESSESSLSASQILDLFDWLTGLQISVSLPDFTPSAGCEELIAFDSAGPDYYQVWLREGVPVAAAAPLDGLFRILPGENA